MAEDRCRARRNSTSRRLIKCPPRTSTFLCLRDRKPSRLFADFRCPAARGPPGLYCPCDEARLSIDTSSATKWCNAAAFRSGAFMLGHTAKQPNPHSSVGIGDRGDLKGGPAAGGESCRGRTLFGSVPDSDGAALYPGRRVMSSGVPSRQHGTCAAPDDFPLLGCATSARLWCRCCLMLIRSSVQNRHILQKFLAHLQSCDGFHRKCPVMAIRSPRNETFAVLPCAQTRGKMQWGGDPM